MPSRTTTERTGRTIANATAGEHADLTVALARFEAALASPSYKRRPWWRRRVARELDGVIAEMKAHRESAEAVGGLYGELELRLGTTPLVRKGRSDHERLDVAAKQLRASLGRRPVPGTEEQPRKDAELLTRDLRRHQALEAELLLEATNRDIGVGD